MLKNIFKRVTKAAIKINIFTVSVGVLSYSVINDLLNKEEKGDMDKNRFKLTAQNKTYTFFKNKFIQNLEYKENHSSIETETISNKDNYKNTNNNNLYSDIDSCQAQIEKLKSENLNILVIGGGSVGAGVLLDSYTRRLKCGLIESFDFASGTSSRSSKLIHEGLRYLEEVFIFDFKVGLMERIKKLALVDESLKEQNFMRTSAVFMNKSLELVIIASNYFSLLYYYNGVFLYQLIYFLSDIKRIGQKDFFNKAFNFYFMPLKLDILNKKIYLYEGQMNDSRQNILSILSCITKNYINKRQMSYAANYIVFTNFLYNDKGEIIGVKAFDKIKKTEFEIKAKIVANCTGIFCDDNFAESDQMKNKMIRASKGTHLIFKDLNISESIMIPKTSDGRVLFIYPYNGYFLAGTTDKAEDKSFYPGVKDEEEKFIVKEMFNYSPEFFLSEEKLREKISSKWSGFRPLVCEEGFSDKTNSKSLARSHIVRYDERSKLYSLMGGKCTTYRNMAKELVDKILENEPELEAKSIKCSSENFKLKGSIETYVEKYDINDFLVEKFFYKDLVKNLENEFGAKYNLSKKLIKNLVRRHGIFSIKVLLQGEKNNTNKILFEDYLESEIRYVIHNEMAVKPNDIICRRIGIGFLNDKVSLESIPLIAKIIGEERNLTSKEVNEMTDEAISLFANKI